MPADGSVAASYFGANETDKEKSPRLKLGPAVAENEDSNQAIFGRNTTHTLRKKNQNPRGIVIQ